MDEEIKEQQLQTLQFMIETAVRNSSQFTLQYTSFDQHKEIIIEEIHVAGTATGVTGKGSRNRPSFFLRSLWHP